MEGAPREDRGPERIISAANTLILVQGLPHMLNSEPLDMGLRRKAEERKLLEEVWQRRNWAAALTLSGLGGSFMSCLVASSCPAPTWLRTLAVYS